MRNCRQLRRRAARARVHLHPLRARVDKEAFAGVSQIHHDVFDSLHSCFTFRALLDDAGRYGVQKGAVMRREKESVFVSLL